MATVSKPDVAAADEPAVVVGICGRERSGRNRTPCFSRGDIEHARPLAFNRLDGRSIRSWAMPASPQLEFGLRAAAVLPQLAFRSLATPVSPRLEFRMSQALLDHSKTKVLAVGPMQSWHLL
jgi:hypothetical protein